MSISPTPPPRFPRLISRPFKKETIYKKLVPSSQHMADISRDQASWSPAKTSKKKTHNAFVKAVKKVIPCVSGKYHELDRCDSLFEDTHSAASRISLPADHTPDVSSRTSLHLDSLDMSGTPISTTSPQCSPSLSEVEPALPQTGATSPPSSLSSIPSSILGEETPRPGQDFPECQVQSAEESVNAEPISLFQAIEALTSTLKQMRMAKKSNPVVRQYLESPTVPLAQVGGLFSELFPVVREQKKSLDSVSTDLGGEEEMLNPSASEDSVSVYSATPPDSVLDQVEPEIHTSPKGDVQNPQAPHIMLSLPTESDLGCFEEEEEQVPAPELLNPRWRPTPEPLRRLSRGYNSRRIVRKMTSAPDLNWMASSFDVDSDDSDEEKEIPSGLIEALRQPETNLLSDSVEEESNITVTGFFPGFLPDTTEPPAYISQKGSVERLFIEGVVSDSTTVLSNSVNSVNKEEHNIPVPSECESDPSSLPVDLFPLSMPSDPQPDLASSDSPDLSSGRRIPLRRTSKTYNRMSGVWGDRFVLKSDFTNFPTHEQAIKADRRGSTVPGLLLPAKRGSMGYIKRPTGIRPLILPARLALRESGEYMGSISTSIYSSGSDLSADVSSAVSDNVNVHVDGDGNAVEGDVSHASNLPSIPSPKSPRYGYF